MTKLDMTKAYFQVPIAPKTGFVTSQGHFQWCYMAFGPRNAPATFSRLEAKVFKDLEEFCKAYLDDVMVFSETCKAKSHNSFKSGVGQDTISKFNN